MIELTKRFVSAAVVFLASALAAGAAPPATLTAPDSIHRLSNAEAAKGIPVVVEATVTYFRSYRKCMFVQDGSAGFFVKATTDVELAPGDRVLIKGATHEGYLPYVVSSDLTLLGHEAVPQPILANYEDLIGPRVDSKLVSVRGVVRAANVDAPSAEHRQGATLKMLTDGGTVDVEVDNFSAAKLDDLLDAEVTVTGVAGGRFDGKIQKTGIVLHASNLDDVDVLERAETDPWSLPVTPMDEIQNAYRVSDLTHRVRVSGVVTYYEPGSTVVLQNGSRSLWMTTRNFLPLRIGDQADATGFPAANDGFLELTASGIRDSGIASPIAPVPVTWQELASNRHTFDLVSIEGRVAATVREAAQDEYVLVSDGYEFSAIYRHPEGAGFSSLAPLKAISVGTRIRVTGICAPLNSNSFGHDMHFNILLRSPEDIAVLSAPGFLNAHNVALFFAGLLLVALVVGMRGWYLEYKNRRSIASLAYLEQRRARILEDINHSEPLAGILERITELVSMRLNGAACWFHVAEGATLGNPPAELSAASLRTVEFPIASRTGPPLGSLFAAFDARTWPGPEEQETLGVAAALAMLAIETSRLYADLVHRSEFDPLTDVENRFVMEKKLIATIDAARQSANIFGLIYIDLNRFKRVNDVYGHMVGDLYLQEMAQRMKKQLRPRDTLARLGGDEFAVLVPVVHNREEVERIASRLESCFHEPFVNDGHVLHGSASVGIALYPEDAETVETLLHAADASMYVAKCTRLGKRRATSILDEDEFTDNDRS
ncbi:MAG: GGDEF domain-containing protein [Terracidiphilus sp.]|jgi:diguanylate cyclase (GGDEF)-like protein